MELDSLDIWFIGSWVLSFLIGLALHEIGHAVAGWAVGFHPRVISIGIGRTIMRWRLGEAWLVFKAIPVAGNVRCLPEQPTGRLRRIAVVAGGPLANALLLAVVVAINLVDASAFGVTHPTVKTQQDLANFVTHLTVQTSLDAFASAQVLLLAVALFPARRKAAGRHIVSDGSKLWQLIIDANAIDNDLPAVYTRLMQDVMVRGAASPPLSPYSAEIVFQTTRQDRRQEAWANRDAIAVLQRILQEEDLPDLERAYVLGSLVAHELSPDKIGVDLGTLDHWSQQALALAPTRKHQLLRARVRQTIGHHCDVE